MKINKFFIALIIFIALIFCNFTFVQANNYLNNLDFNVQVNEDGSMNVKETWDIDISNTNTLYKTFETDYTKYSGISDVIVKRIHEGEEIILRKWNQWEYHLITNTYYAGMNNDNMFEIAWGVGLDESRGTRTYEISYVVKDAIAKYADYAQLYWQFVGKDFEISANKITGTIILPQSANNIEDVRVWGHSEDLNGEIYVTSPNTISFELNDFRSGRFLEIRSLFPTQMITYSNRGQSNVEILDSVISEETVWANEANAKRQQSFLMVIAIILILIILVIINLRRFIQERKMKLKPTQDIIYYREIPRKDFSPSDALTLYNYAKREHNSNEFGNIFSATLLDLSLKKLIEFEIIKSEKDEETVKIKIINNDAEEKLNDLDDEKIIFEFLQKACNDDTEITIEELEKYIKNKGSDIVELKNSINSETKKKLKEKQLYNEEGAKRRGKLILNIFINFSPPFMAVFVLTSLISTPITNIIIALLLLLNVIILLMNYYSIDKLNQKGIDEASKLRGLKKYLEEFSIIDKRKVPDIILWEEFLVYATAFGIAENVIKQLELVYPNFNETMARGNNDYRYIYLMRNTNFTIAFSASISNSISKSISSTYSSGSGSGGGFSGGGGGGRRSEEVEEVDKAFYTNKNIKEKRYLWNKKI